VIFRKIQWLIADNIIALWLRVSQMLRVGTAQSGASHWISPIASVGLILSPLSFFVEHHWYCLYMSEQTSRPNPIIEQVGKPLTMDDLPPPNIRRWITRRKAEVATAVRTGLLSLDEACVRYGITSEELLSWQRLLDEHGLRGLRATRLQEYRHAASRPAPAHLTAPFLTAAYIPPHLSGRRRLTRTQRIRATLLSVPRRDK